MIYLSIQESAYKCIHVLDRLVIVESMAHTEKYGLDRM